MKIYKVASYEQMSQEAAKHILKVMTEKPNALLGLATGSTPVGMYQALIRETRATGFSWQHIVTYNLDEYVGLDALDEQSYAHFMNVNLFDHVSIDQAHVHIPNGKAEDLEAECRAYEASLKTAGGVDIQVLGIGRNGHIGFNEPNDAFEPYTHVVHLDEKTIEDNARFFESKEKVPKTAISMGVESILSAKKIILLACGKEKAQALYDMLYGPITPQLPASILQKHGDVEVICDEAAASLLKGPFDV